MFETVIEINQFLQIYYELTIMFNYDDGWHDRDAKISLIRLFPLFICS